MKESTVEKSLMNANNVISVVLKQEIRGDTKESLLERNLINANSVGTVLPKQDI